MPRDPTTPSSDVLVLDLGRMKWTSRLHPRGEQKAFIAKLREMTREEQNRLSDFDRSKCYMVFNVAMKNVAVFLTTGLAASSGQPILI